MHVSVKSSSNSDMICRPDVNQNKALAHSPRAPLIVSRSCGFLLRPPLAVHSVVPDLYKTPCLARWAFLQHLFTQTVRAFDMDESQVTAARDFRKHVFSDTLESV